MATLEVGSAPDRPSTPSSDEDETHQRAPRVVRDEDLADGEEKPASTVDTSNSSPTSPPARSERTPREKAPAAAATPRPVKATYVRPETTKKVQLFLGSQVQHH